MNVMKKAYKNKDRNAFARRLVLSKIWGESSLLVIVEGIDDERFFRTKLFGQIQQGSNVLNDVYRSSHILGKDAVIESLKRLEQLKMETIDNTRNPEYHVIGIVDRDRDKNFFKNGECRTNIQDYLYCYDDFDLENTILRSSAFLCEARIGDTSDLDQKHLQNRRVLIELAEFLTRLWERKEIKKIWKDPCFQKDLCAMMYKYIDKKMIDVKNLKRECKALVSRHKIKIDKKDVNRLFCSPGKEENYVRGKQLLTVSMIYFDPNKNIEDIEKVDLIETLIRSYTFAQSKLYKVLSKLEYVDFKHEN